MSNKTPWEIRLEVLAMAKDMAAEHYFANRERLINTWDRDAENARQTGSPIPKMPDIPEYPTEEVIVKKAQFLSEFIDSPGKIKNKPELLTE